MFAQFRPSSLLITKADDIAFYQSVLPKVENHRALVLNTLKIADAKARYAELFGYELSDLFPAMMLNYSKNIQPYIDWGATSGESVADLRQSMKSVVIANNNLIFQAKLLRKELAIILNECPDSLSSKLPALDSAAKTFVARGDALYKDAQALSEQLELVHQSIARTAARLSEFAA